MTTSDPETRRGLKVHRPKGQPFTYTVETDAGHRLELCIAVQGYNGESDIEVYSWQKCTASGGNLRTYWEPARIHFSPSGVARGYDQYQAAENFAAAIRWAVRYARRWNAKHVKGGET